MAHARSTGDVRVSIFKNRVHEVVNMLMSLIGLAVAINLAWVTLPLSTPMVVIFIAIAVAGALWIGWQNRAKGTRMITGPEALDQACNELRGSRRGVRAVCYRGRLGWKAITADVLLLLTFAAAIAVQLWPAHSPLALQVSMALLTVSGLGHLFVIERLATVRRPYPSGFVFAELAPELLKD